MRILATLGLVFALMLPSAVFAADDFDVTCRCQFRALVATKSLVGVTPSGDVTKNDVKEFPLGLMDKETGKISGVLNFHRKLGDDFSFNVVGALFATVLKQSPNVTQVDADKGTFKLDGKTMYAFPKTYLESSEVELNEHFIVGADTPWSITKDKDGCVPKSEDKDAVAFFGTDPVGMVFLKMQCQTLPYTPKKSDEPGTANGTSDKGKGHVDGVPGGSGIGGGLAIKSKLDPIGTSLQVLVGRLIRIGLGILGSVALVVFIYGGLTWMTAMGNAERTKKAFSTLVWGVLGIVVILASYAIVDFVMKSFK